MAHLCPFGHCLFEKMKETFLEPDSTSFHSLACMSLKILGPQVSAACHRFSPTASGPGIPGHCPESGHGQGNTVSSKVAPGLPLSVPVHWTLKAAVRATEPGTQEGPEPAFWGWDPLGLYEIVSLCQFNKPGGEDR